MAAGGRRTLAGAAVAAVSTPGPMLEALWRIHYMTGMGWTVETVSAVEAETKALPVALRARTASLMRADGQGARHRNSSPG